MHVIKFLYLIKTRLLVPVTFLKVPNFDYILPSQNKGCTVKHASVSQSPSSLVTITTKLVSKTSIVTIQTIACAITARVAKLFTLYIHTCSVRNHAYDVITLTRPFTSLKSLQQPQYSSKTPINICTLQITPSSTLLHTFRLHSY